MFGEGVHLLGAQGNAEAAIQVEGLCNQLAKGIRRGYSVRVFYWWRSGRDGNPLLRENLCRAFSRLFPVKVPGEFGGEPAVPIDVLLGHQLCTCCFPSVAPPSTMPL